MSRKSLIILVSAIVLGAFLFTGYKLEKNLYRHELEREYNTKILGFEQALKSSEQARLVANHRADSLDNALKNIVARDKIVTDSLARIPGTFKNFTSKQLEERMEAEFKKSHQ